MEYTWATAANLVRHSRMATRRRWLQFSLRGFLVVLTIGCLWLGWKFDGALKQRETIKAVEAIGGVVAYDWQTTSVYEEYGMYVLWSANRKRNRTPRNWLSPITGHDLFHNVDVVGVPATRLVEAMPHLDRLPRLSHILIIFPAGQPPDGWPLD